MICEREQSDRADHKCKNNDVSPFLKLLPLSQVYYLNSANKHNCDYGFRSVLTFGRGGDDRRGSEETQRGGGDGRVYPCSHTKDFFFLFLHLGDSK